MAAKKTKPKKTKNASEQAPIPECPTGKACAEPSCHVHGAPHTG